LAEAADTGSAASGGIHEGQAGHLFEREAELEALSSALADALEGRGSTFAVVGPPGIGKTSLLETLVARARRLRAAVRTGSGSEFERGFPFAIAGQLLTGAIAGLQGSAQAEVLAGAATLGAAGIGWNVETGSQPAGDESLFAVVDGLYWLASNLAERRPLVLVVDDAQWADAESLRWISYLGRRVEELPILLALGVRTAEPGTEWEQVESMIRDSGARIIEPRPLSDDAIGRLIAGRLDSQPESRFVEACAAATGGNPFLVDQLLVSLARDDVEPVDEQAGRIAGLGAPTVARAALERVARLGPNATELAKAIAILGDESQLPIARDLAGLEAAAARDAADGLVAASVLRGDPPLRFAHPLVRAAIYNETPPAERALAHTRAARLLAEHGATVDRVAGHLLDGEPGGDAWTVERFREAARTALGRGAPKLAARYLRRALSEPPVARARAAVTKELGYAEVVAGQPEEALIHLEQALDLTADPVERTAVWRGQALALLNVGRPDAAIERLQSAIEQSDGGDAANRLRLEADLASLEVMSLTSDHAATRDRLAGLTTQFDGGDPSGGVLLGALSHLRMGDCEPATEVAAMAERALSSEVRVEPGPALIGRAQGMATLICADAIDRAESISSAELADARTRGATFEISLNELFLAVAALFRGAISDAEAGARHVLELAREHGLPAEVATATAVLTESLVERGEYEEAWRELEGLGMTGELPRVNTFIWVLSRRGRLRSVSGDHEGGLDDLLEAGRRYADWGVVNPAEARWLSDAALIKAALGDDEEARALAEEEVTLARRFGAPRALGVALRARGLVEGGARGLEFLREAVAVLAGSVARLEYAYALTEFGAALRRANKRAEAREPLKEGLTLARSCGAVPLAERAHDELAATGARPRKIIRSGVEELTPSERRVARMAASGMRNKEIAQALFVTERTVETHLRHTYQKLDISSRGELSAALEGG
jgi:DNA-binding CsgD family transcriptional regulator